MKSSSYQVGIWATLFAFKARNFRIIRFESDGVIIGTHNDSRKISYSQVSGSLSAKKGLFWSVLKVPLIQGRVLNFGGVRSAAMTGLLEVANAQMDAYYRQQGMRLTPRLTNLTYQWNRLSNSQQYFRHSQMEAWLAQADRLSGYLSRPHLERYMSPEASMAVRQVRLARSTADSLRAEANRKYLMIQRSRYKEYFDSIESQPLTEAQRTACIIHEDCNLVLAGAGTGKTSTMVGKAGYLLSTGMAKAEEVLMLAFASKAAQEMDERMKDRLNTRSLTVKTFHSLGLEIITKVEGKKPALSKLSEDEIQYALFVESIVKDLVRKPAYRSRLVSYFLYYLTPGFSQLHFKSMAEYEAYRSEHELRTLQGERVKSLEELMIANFLYRQGVRYCYEKPYSVNIADSAHRAYYPDFYLPEFDLYLEHFAVDEHNHTPPFIDGKTYRAGMAWKRDVHKRHNTKLIESYSYWQRDGVLLEKLEALLLASGVVFQPIPEHQLLDELNRLHEVTEFSKLVASVMKLLKASCLSMESLIDMVGQGMDRWRMTAAIQLIAPVIKRYEHELQRRNEIDFEDMINRALRYVEGGQYQSPYHYILVDEFQDISIPRARLVKALLAQNAQNSLFAVGDDWQSIYRFAGSDVSITNEFEAFFGKTEIGVLDKTFRFNDRIGEVASLFVQQNPAQMKKEMISHHTASDTAISLLSCSDDELGIQQAFEAICELAMPNASVLLLTRFNHRKPDKERLAQQYPGLRIDVMSVHASKGREADYVIVVGMEKGKNGFPSEKLSHPLIECLLPAQEGFAYAEERRLFYVAITRARHHVYLLSDLDKTSIFIQELIKGGYDVRIMNEATDMVASRPNSVVCPRCHTGLMIVQRRIGQKSQSACSAPQCSYRETSGIIAQKASVKPDLPILHTRINDGSSVCPLCQGALVRRQGANGLFLACSNYRGNHPDSCRYTQGLRAREADQKTSQHGGLVL